MAWWAWILLILGSVYLYSRRGRQDLNSEEKTDLANWFEDQELSWGSAAYSTYRGQPFAEAPNGLVVIGVANPTRGGPHIGFCVEYATGIIVQGQTSKASLAGRNNQYAGISKSIGAGMYSQFLADINKVE